MIKVNLTHIKHFFFHLLLSGDCVKVLGTDEHQRSCTDCVFLSCFCFLPFSLSPSPFHLPSHANSSSGLHTCVSQGPLTHPLPPYRWRHRLFRCSPIYSSQRPRCQGQSGLCFHNKSLAQNSVCYPPCFT